MNDTDRCKAERLIAVHTRTPGGHPLALKAEDAETVRCTKLPTEHWFHPGVLSDGSKVMWEGPPC